MTKRKQDWCDSYAAKYADRLIYLGERGEWLARALRTAYRRGVADTKVAYGTYEFTHEGRAVLKRRIAALKRGKP